MNNTLHGTKKTSTLTLKRSTKPASQRTGSDSDNDIKKLVHTLQVYQIELEHQNQELRITEEDLEVSRNKYVNFFDFSPIPYFVLDLPGKITELNLRAATIIGLERNKLIGKSFDAFVTREDRILFDNFLATMSTSLMKQSCTVNVVNHKKSVFHVLLEGIRTDDVLESNQRCQIALIDLTGYRKLEHSIQEISNELTLLKKTATMTR
jgi:PAS domain S-box-containing protein